MKNSFKFLVLVLITIFAFNFNYIYAEETNLENIEEIAKENSEVVTLNDNLKDDATKNSTSAESTTINQSDKQSVTSNESEITDDSSSDELGNDEVKKEILEGETKTSGNDIETKTLNDETEENSLNGETENKTLGEETDLKTLNDVDSLTSVEETDGEEDQSTKNDLADSKTITVDANAEEVEGKSYKTIQAAINYLRTLGDENVAKRKDGPEDGWTIVVAAGSYARFNVLNGIDNLTIKSNDNASISVLDGSAIESTKITYVNSKGKNATVNANAQATSNSGVAVNAGNLKLEGLTFEAGSTSKSWWGAAVEVGNGMTSMERADGLVINSCIFNGSGSKNAIFIDNGATIYTITNNIIDNFNQGLYFEDYSKNPMNVNINNNTFTNTSFAIHGSWDNGVNKTAEEGNYSFKDNKVTGTEEKRNKVVIQDSPDRGSTVLTISGNELTHAMIGLVNLDNDKDEKNDLNSTPLTDNTYNENSYYVRGNEPGEIDYYVTYEAPEDSYGYWSITGLEDRYWSEEQKELIRKAIEDANEKGSRVLNISDLETGTLIRTFTYMKDAIYWNSYPIVIKVDKVWNDAENADELRPESVTVRVKANGEEIKVIELNETNEWTYSFGVMEYDENGQIIEYVVTEDKVSDYETEITGSVKDGFTITNTHLGIGDGEEEDETGLPPKTGYENNILLQLVLLVSAIMSVYAVRKF